MVNAYWVERAAAGPAATSRTSRTRAPASASLPRRPSGGDAARCADAGPWVWGCGVRGVHGLLRHRASSFEDTVPRASGANAPTVVVTASGIGGVLLSLRRAAGPRPAPPGRAAVRAVLPSTATTGERRGRRRKRARARTGSGRAQAAGRHADSSTRHEPTTHPPPHPHSHRADGGDGARPRRARARQVVQRRPQEPLGVLVHLVGDQPRGGRSPAARRLRRALPAGARRSRESSWRAPSSSPPATTARSITPVDDRRRPQGLPLLLGDPDGRASRATWRLDKAGNFRPTEKVTAAGAETVMIRWLKERYSSYDWSLLTTLGPSRWKPNPGWSTGAPSYLPAIVASRQLELRFNHPTGDDGHEALPGEPIDRAEIAYMFDRAYKVGEQLAAVRPRRLQGHHLPGAERPAEADREVRAQVGRLPLHLGGRVPDARTRPTARRSPAGSTARASSSTS